MQATTVSHDHNAALDVATHPAHNVAAAPMNSVFDGSTVWHTADTHKWRDKAQMRKRTSHRGNCAAHSTESTKEQDDKKIRMQNY